MKNFRTYQLAKNFYKKGKELKLKGEAKNQFERARLSIALNIMEGSGRSRNKDRARFFQIAYGSAKECWAILDLLDESTKEADELCASLYRLIQNPGPGPRVPAA